MIFFLLLRSTVWILLLHPLALAQNHHQPPIHDRYRSSSRHAGIIVGVSIGIILLLFLAFVLYARIASRRREASRERARTDEEFTIAPLPTQASTVIAPPPYENPPSFEDAMKRTQMTSAIGHRPREEDGRDGVTG